VDHVGRIFDHRAVLVPAGPVCRHACGRFAQRGSKLVALGIHPLPRRDAPARREREYHRADRHHRAFVPPHELPQPVRLADRGGDDRLAGEVPSHVVGQGVGGVVSAGAVLVERLHHDPVEFAFEFLSAGRRNAPAGVRSGHASEWCAVNWMWTASRDASERITERDASERRPTERHTTISHVSERRATKRRPTERCPTKRRATGDGQRQFQHPHARRQRLLLADDAAHLAERRRAEPTRVERRHARQQFVQQHAQRVDVRPRVDVGRAFGLLGAHVLGRADELEVLGEERLVGEAPAGRAGGLGDAEVDDLRERPAVD
jgi:hypothetical protein